MADPQAPPENQAARAAAIVAALGAGAGVAAGAGAVAGAAGGLSAAVVRAVTRLLLSWGYSKATVGWGVRVTVRVTRERPRRVPAEAPAGPAGDATNRAARSFAAWFIDATTARVEAAVAAGVDPDEAQAREERYVDQHLDAQDRRQAAAEAVDAEAAKPGNAVDTSDRTILGWVAVEDDKVTPECRAADGCWFYADTPPIIGYPGGLHAGRCRCRPGPITAAAAARGRSVDEATRATVTKEPDHRDHPGATPRRTA